MATKTPKGPALSEEELKEIFGDVNLSKEQRQILEKNIAGKTLEQARNDALNFLSLLNKGLSNDELKRAMESLHESIEESVNNPKTDEEKRKITSNLANSIGEDENYAQDLMSADKPSKEEIKAMEDAIDKENAEANAHLALFAKDLITSPADFLAGFGDWMVKNAGSDWKLIAEILKVVSEVVNFVVDKIVEIPLSDETRDQFHVLQKKISDQEAKARKEAKSQSSSAYSSDKITQAYKNQASVENPDQKLM